ncbi:MAG: hypothetical protein ACFCU8_11210 [Thermosynechococcaceae cyanobacterium]
MRSNILFPIALCLGAQGITSIASAQNPFPSNNLGNLQRTNQETILQQPNREPTRPAPPPQPQDDALAVPTAEIEDPAATTPESDGASNEDVRKSANPSCPSTADDPNVEPGVFEVETEIEPIPSASAC